ncbi:TonB-dependent receptor [Terrihabitans rhizophilus]|uniref:TonB-dependent receptor n=1 Tax=Terrihabitans rhizophilus TaxID=3092662 RepID=A0ABU4RQ80_9HYPH|nr:TonB-dependent receptor [Terrihabitans sp. PJ23]MDX6806992.1 TonB-dependent receptor [Terrihabitans sp. PJ23]
MTKISHTGSLREQMSHTAVTAGLALSFAAMAQSAAAQGAQPVAGEQDVELETITVEGSGTGEGSGEGTPNTLRANTGIARLPGSVQDTPQIINVIPRETLQQQNVTSLEQALRNAPGITTAIGEGNGGLNGDQFRIRGFEAKGDIFTDGLRDFGVMVRDSFNYESVEVLKGPSSESFGVGSTGGAINTTSKIPHLDDWYRADATIGNGPLYRGTFDVNKQVNDTTAVRFVGLAHEQDVLDRDNVHSDRYGFAASVGFGLGTDTTWTLQYFFQHTDRMPDYGVPVINPGFGDIAANGSQGRPVTEFGVDRDTFYGKETDQDVGNVHAVTSRFRKEVNDWITFSNDTRFAFYDRDFSASVPGCGAGTAVDGVVPEPSYEASCTGQFFNGANPTIAFGGGNPSYFQESWGVQNVSTAIMKFETGVLRHEVVAGVDFLYQHDQRDAKGIVGNKGTQPIRNPIFENETGYTVNYTGAYKESESTNVGLFVSDRVWFTEQLSVLAGVRWDYFDVSYDSVSTAGVSSPFDQETDFFSPKASLIWEPTKLQTYYFSYATSASVAGQFPTNAANTISDGCTTSPTMSCDGFQAVQPEENESFELGAKVGLLDGKLGVTAALFRVNKDNAFITDPTTGDTLATNERQRVQGLELGISGNITKEWTVLAGYTYLDSEILGDSFTTTASNVGNRVPFVAEHAISLWTTYDISSVALRDIPGILLVGGGVTWRDEVFLNNTNTNIAPSNFTLDALASYENDNWRVALNGYNLTDELNYDGLWANRAIPSAGRAVTMTVGAKF